MLRIGRLSLNRDTREVFQDGRPVGLTPREADTGFGIPSDILPRVTERFGHGDSSRARSTGAFGLGLSIAHGIANAHRGTISIDSRTGRGTTVVVTLPRVTSD